MTIQAASDRFDRRVYKASGVGAPSEFDDFLPSHVPPLRHRAGPPAQPTPRRTSEYRWDENRVLQSPRPEWRFRFTDDERKRPAVRGAEVGRALLTYSATIVTPDTILCRHRKLVGAKRPFKTAGRDRLPSASNWGRGGPSARLTPPKSLRQRLNPARCRPRIGIGTPDLRPQRGLRQAEILRDLPNPAIPRHGKVEGRPP